MASYRCWLFDKDKNTLAIRALECATEEVEERAWALLRAGASAVHATDVWDGKKCVRRLERAMPHKATRRTYRREFP